MSAIAVTCFVIAAVIIWGGLIASIVFLSMKPSVGTYPEGGNDAEGDVQE
ncbi:hypothetical protein K8P10_000146 [Leucobacter sp. Psy1]|nr:MetS family NSS transporter small subunit [Leucobacter sp. Psy1]UBH04635.1 hypothetical protein K8P10_000146 [Leucobacter sp. Psy1]